MYCDFANIEETTFFGGKVVSMSLNFLSSANSEKNISWPYIEPGRNRLEYHLLVAGYVDVNKEHVGIFQSSIPVKDPIWQPLDAKCLELKVIFCTVSGIQLWVQEVSHFLTLWSFRCAFTSILATLCRSILFTNEITIVFVVSYIFWIIRMLVDN